MKKRVFAILLSVVLALSVMPSGLAAVTEEEDPALTAEALIETSATEPVGEAQPTEAAEEPTDTITEPIEEPATEAAEITDEPIVSVKEDLAPTAAARVPVITEVCPSLHGAKISWNKMSGVSQYYVFIRRADDSGWKKLGLTADTVFEHRFTPDDTTNIYTVRAVDKNGDFIGEAAKRVSFRCLAVPKLTAVENVNAGQKITWSSVKGAENYRIYLKSDDTWKPLAVTDKTSYTNKDLTSGKSYTYTVRCWNTDDDTALSYYTRAGITATFISAPEIASATPAKDGFKITWKAVKGATRYAFFIKTEKNWKRLTTTEDTSFTHTGLTDKTSYTYTVRCVDKDGAFCSGCDKNGVTFRYLAPPVVSSVSASSKGNLIKWKKNASFAMYRVYRKTFGGSWEQIGKTDSTDYTDTKANKTTLYTYTLRGADENGTVLTYFTNTATYYKNGKAADGSHKIDGVTYRFSKGKLVSGYYKIGKRTYYYNSKGVIRKNGIVGSAKDGYTYADENGVCCTSEEIKLAAEFLMKYGTGSTLKEKCKTGFLYMARHFPYRRSYDRPTNKSHLSALAIDLFKRKSGNCFRYAAAFACTAKIAGYRVRTVVGTTGNGAPHGWVEVKVGSRWLICDPDAQLAIYGKPAYGAYMMRYHFWGLIPHFKSELTINADGKLIWN